MLLPPKASGFLERLKCRFGFAGHKVGEFEADILVEECLLLELKAVRGLDSAHEAQLLNYLRATEIEVGILFNFGIKPDFKRLAFDNARKHHAKRTNLLDSMLAADQKEH
jgi:GxxExxY protein